VPLPGQRQLLYPQVSVSLDRVLRMQQFESLSALLSFAAAVPAKELARARPFKGREGLLTPPALVDWQRDREQPTWERLGASAG
jgi:hypothetical protein